MASLLDIFKETNGPNRQFVKGKEGRREGGKEEAKQRVYEAKSRAFSFPPLLSSFTSLPVIAPAFAPSRVSPLSFRLRRCDLVRIVVGEV